MHAWRELIAAWMASACALSLAFVCFMLITMVMEGGPLTLKAVIGTALMGFAVGIVIQFVYGGLVYAVLMRLGGYDLWRVTIAYVAPVLLFSWRFSETSNDITGTVPWIVFAVLLAVVSWFFVSGRGTHLGLS